MSICISLVFVLLATPRPFSEYHSRAIMRSVVEGFHEWWGERLVVLWNFWKRCFESNWGVVLNQWGGQEQERARTIMMQEVNLGRKSLLVLKKPFLCHYMLGLRISIGEENQCVACRLYRAVLLIYAFVLSLYIIIFLQPSKHTNPQRNKYLYWQEKAKK